MLLQFEGCVSVDALLCTSTRAILDNCVPEQCARPGVTAGIQVFYSMYNITNILLYDNQEMLKASCMARRIIIVIRKQKYQISLPDFSTPCMHVRTTACDICV